MQLLEFLWGENFLTAGNFESKIFLAFVSDNDMRLQDRGNSCVAIPCCI